VTLWPLLASSKAKARFQMWWLGLATAAAYKMLEPNAVVKSDSNKYRIRRNLYFTKPCMMYTRKSGKCKFIETVGKCTSKIFANK
jgi:hypothetical protein